VAVCLQCGQRLTTKSIGAWFPGKGLLCGNCTAQGSGKASISLLFQDGDHKESSDIVLSCDKAEFKSLLESLISESQKHIAPNIESEKKAEFMCLECGQKFYSVQAAEKASFWSEPLRVDNELSNINSWREVHEKDEAALRPSIQDVSSSRT